MNYEFHEAAEMWDDVDESLVDTLVESIRQIGLTYPIVLCDGKVLDGRHRLRACQRVGVTPEFVTFEGNPWTKTIACNQRRDMDQGRKAATMLLAWQRSGEWDRAQQERQRAANQARSEKAEQQIAGQERDESGKVKPGLLSRDKRPGTDSHEQPEQIDPPDHAHVVFASLAGVSPATAARTQALANKRPDLLDRVASGEIKLSQAMREQKRDDVAQRVEALPSSTYRVIYADPPWQYNDTRAGLAGYEATAAEDHYPTMSVPELCALDVKSLADADAVLFCWATAPLLEDALVVVKAWGFTYKTHFVWDKQRANMGHYHTASHELLLVCTRGSCTPDSQRREPSVVRIERGNHSQKPDDFRVMVDRMYTHGRRVELFRRGVAPEGWDAWGNEAVTA